jgi:molecular chaperone GrpE
MTLILRKLRSILEAQGLTEIEAVGEPFDPSLHEAVAHHEGEEGVVIGEVQRGYKLKDRVLRPTLAVVGKGKEEKADEEGPEGATGT